MGLRRSKSCYEAAGTAEGRALKEGRNLAGASFFFQKKRSLFFFKQGRIFIKSVTRHKITGVGRKLAQV